MQSAAPRARKPHNLGLGRRQVYLAVRDREVCEVTYLKVPTVGPNQTLRHLKGAETWFQQPPILLRVRPQSALHRSLPKGLIVQGLFWLINSEPGLGPNKPTTTMLLMCTSNVTM